jgi:hypothetical protein
VAKLTEIGWGEELQILKESYQQFRFRKHVLVNQPKDLTERSKPNIDSYSTIV